MQVLRNAAVSRPIQSLHPGSNKNVAGRTNDIASRQKLTVLGPLWRINPLWVFFGRIENMIVATLFFLGFIVTAGAAVVKAYEWHQDVLYGPYLERSIER